MTNKKKSKGQKDVFMKKVSSLFNIDMVNKKMLISWIINFLIYRLNYAEAVNLFFCELLWKSFYEWSARWSWQVSRRYILDLNESSRFTLSSFGLVTMKT